MKQVSGQMSLFDLDMLSGRMSLELSLPTKEKISASSSKSFAKSKTKAPMFLDLRTGSGNLAGVSWETGIPWLGASSTLNFGECPNVVEESGLSQILEDNVPQKYYLSERACIGVLRRAERRGKELKPILKLALEQQIERWRKYGSPLPVFGVDAVRIEGVDIYNGTTTGKVSKTITSAATDSDHIPCVCYDARGNGDGEVVPTITGDHNNRLTDYTALVCEKFAENSSGDGISGTIDASYYKGIGSREGKDGGGKGALVQEDKSGTIAFNNDQVLFQRAETQYIVRRLTSLECCRLQGMPDWWCADIPHSDAQEYRLWGNGMALPNALYIIEGLVESKE